MKIVNREEFMKMPKGTVYSYYEPCIFEGLYVKASKEDNLFHDAKKRTLNDFVLIPLIDGFVKGSYDNNVNHKDLDHFEFDLTCSVRDGLYDDKQLFAVYDKNDILKLVARITISPIEENKD